MKRGKYIIDRTDPAEEFLRGMFDDAGTDTPFLLNACRYYKGENNNPHEGKDQNKTMLWFYEKKWVEFSLNSNHSGILSSYIEEYDACGLCNFEEKDEIPKSLKALLFNRYARWSYSMLHAVEPFKEFYRLYYKTENQAQTK